MLPQKTQPGKPLILLVDDNADMRKYIERLLEDHQYEVRAVSNGLEALRLPRSRSPTWC